MSSENKVYYAIYSKTAEKMQKKKHITIIIPVHDMLGMMQI